MRTALMVGVGIFAAILTAGCTASTDSAGGAGGISAASAGPTDFSKKVDQIRPGTPKTQVISTLGKPDVREQAIGAQPTGPQPPIVIPAGSRYEHWVYHRGDTDYHVFLGQSVANPGQWEVLATSANPAHP